MVGRFSFFLSVFRFSQLSSLGRRGLTVIGSVNLDTTLVGLALTRLVSVAANDFRLLFFSGLGGEDGRNEFVFLAIIAFFLGSNLELDSFAVHVLRGGAPWCCDGQTTKGDARSNL